MAPASAPRAGMALEWLGLALAAAVLNGLSVLAAKPSTDRLGPPLMGLGAILAEGLVFGAAGLLLPRAPITAGAGAIAGAILAGILGAVGYPFFFAGMRRGSVGLVGTISAAAPLLTVALSVALLGEALGGLQVLGIATTMACVLLLAVEPRRSSANRRAAVLLSLGGFLTWGLWGFLLKTGVDALGEGNLFLLMAAAYLAVAAVIGAVSRRGLAPRVPAPGRVWAVGLAVFLVGGIAAVALTTAYDVGSAALVAPVAGTYPVIATLGAWAVLRERPDWRIGVALVLFVVGISLLSTA